MSLSPIQKEAILRNINKVPVDSLKRKIDNNELTLEECIENGLSQTTVDEIHFIASSELEAERQFEEDAAFYEKINNDELIIQEIKAAIFEGRVTEEGLKSNTIIDETLLYKIKNYEDSFRQPEINEEPTKKGYTDIFFFGRSGSGKSCVLASLFHYGEKEGYLVDDPHSIKGINYKNDIVTTLRNGVLPAATSADEGRVTYITTELHHKDTDDINLLNIIEMSGEFFTAAAKDPSMWANGVDAHGYLSNSNKKLLFFVIDFEIHIDPHKVSTQEASFNLMLSQLDNYNKCLKNTYCIYIIVNKSDLFPADELLEYNNDRSQYAKNFFTENYKSFYTNLKNKQDKNGFELRYLHYSLGNFMFKNSYLSEINYECPKQLIKTIQHQAGRKKSGGWFDNMFDSND